MFQSSRAAHHNATTPPHDTVTLIHASSRLYRPGQSARRYPSKPALLVLEEVEACRPTSCEKFLFFNDGQRSGTSTAAWISWDR